jgi:hypothetical protein
MKYSFLLITAFLTTLHAETPIAVREITAPPAELKIPAFYKKIHGDRQLVELWTGESKT